jgi:hypothetical protein
MSARPLLGTLLLEARKITQEQLDRALQRQRALGPGARRLGALLVEDGVLEEESLTHFLGQQLSIPCVSLRHVDFSRHLLSLVPTDLAVRHGVVPVYLRPAHKSGMTLFLAMTDPTDEDALRAVSEASGLPTRPMIAPATEIANAVTAFYNPPPPEPPSPVLSILPLESLLPDAPTVRPAPKLQRPSVQPSPVDAPNAGRPKMLTLTLLDGSQLVIPAPEGHAEPPAAEAQPTTRDLIAALRAVAQGTPASEVLGAQGVEKLLAALLATLLRKHLVTDWEFIAELRRV